MILQDPRQPHFLKQFVDEYLVDPNATQAAIEIASAADAFRASVRSRDTVDTADTSSPRPPAPECCVDNVSSVIGPRHTKYTSIGSGAGHGDATDSLRAGTMRLASVRPSADSA
jgi:hypothetical protein